MIFLDIAFYTFIVVVICQIIYYGIVFSQFAFAKPTYPKTKKISISILVCAKNEAKNLEKNIPAILEQDYPDFEVILINDGSTDETLKVMKTFESNNNNIKVVDVKSIETFWGNKKYALTLGIKAANHEYLLLTDADCQPASNKWIKQMSSHFSNSKSLIIGYGGYEKEKTSPLNKLIRYETLLTAVQYFSYAKLGMPYMAVGRNLAYTKSEFFDNRGFMGHMNVRSGDDDLFVNEVATAQNTALCFTKSSFTVSPPKTSFAEWFRQKRRHVSTAKHYKSKHKFLLGLFYLTQFLFWGLGIFLAVILFNWEIVVGLIVLRFIIQFLTIGKAAKKLNEIDTIYILPFLELFLIISQFFIFISNLTSKSNHWR